MMMGSRVRHIVFWMDILVNEYAKHINFHGSDHLYSKIILSTLISLQINVYCFLGSYISMGLFSLYIIYTHGIIEKVVATVFLVFKFSCWCLVSIVLYRFLYIHIKYNMYLLHHLIENTLNSGFVFYVLKKGYTKRYYFKYFCNSLEY